MREMYTYQRYILYEEISISLRGSTFEVFRLRVSWSSKTDAHDDGMKLTILSRSK